jgi:predicted nucleic acid-binding protein
MFVRRKRELILVDSFGWIEYLVDGQLASRYEEYLTEAAQLVTPTIVLYEVYKKLRRERKEEEALLVVAQMMKSKVVPLTEDLALSAAEISLNYSLPMADAIVYATAIREGCPVATSDPHFKELRDVIYIGD